MESYRVGLFGIANVFFCSNNVIDTLDSSKYDFKSCGLNSSIPIILNTSSCLERDAPQRHGALDEPPPKVLPCHPFILRNRVMDRATGSW